MRWLKNSPESGPVTIQNPEEQDSKVDEIPCRINDLAIIQQECDTRASTYNHDPQANLDSSIRGQSEAEDCGAGLPCGGARDGQIIVVHTSWASRVGPFPMIMFVNYEAKDPGREVVTCGGWRPESTLQSMDHGDFL